MVARKDLHGVVADFVRTIRGDIKNYIMFHPDFAASLEPVEVDDSAPEIVRTMAEAASLCGVGPMAAVAGTVSQMVADAFVDQSPDILVENGGDVYMHSSRERLAALLADPESGAQVGLRLVPELFPVSLCSSSGRIGHSLSLGQGDLVCVLAKNGAFADAAATALCNLLAVPADVEFVLKRAQELVPAGLLGVFAQCDDQLAAWGELELVALD